MMVVVVVVGAELELMESLWTRLPRPGLIIRT
jgi:hypothetical protein